MKLNPIRGAATRVVRWPPCASFCTPASATLAARTSASAAASAILAPYVHVNEGGQAVIGNVGGATK
jgi:hypothetical protein